MAYSVTRSQPRPRWLAGAPGATVSTRLRSITPCSNHGVRSPSSGFGTSRSLTSSVKMFTRLRGSGRTSLATENDSPTG